MVMIRIKHFDMAEFRGHSHFVSKLLCTNAAAFVHLAETTKRVSSASNKLYFLCFCLGFYNMPNLYL